MVSAILYYDDDMYLSLPLHFHNFSPPHARASNITVLSVKHCWRDVVSELDVHGLHGIIGSGIHKGSNVGDIG